jgi:hypothetical protein
MKKIFYAIAFVAVVFTSCQKQPIVPLYPAVATVQSYNFTLASSDYALLPSTAYPSKTFSFNDAIDAQTYIPTILNAKYPSKVAADGSTAVVTYTQSAPSFKLADSTIADVAYTLTPADYLLLPSNKYADFSLAQVVAWLPYKFPSAVANQLELLTFTPYPATLTPPYSFLFLNGKWQQIYTITPAEYTAFGVGKYNQFTSANDATLPAMLGALIKTDVTIQDTVKAGDIEYISFNYYGIDKNTYQRVIPLEYDGSNYVAPKTSVAAPLNFIKKSGQWQYVTPLPIFNYVLTTADETLISNSTFGSSTQRSDLGKYGDFDSSWAKADLQSAFILCLTKDITAPQINTDYHVHYESYVNSVDTDTVLGFTWDGTKWVAE